MPEYGPESFVPTEKPTNQPDEVMDTGTGLDRTILGENVWQLNPNRFAQKESSTDGFDDTLKQAIDDASPENPEDNLSSGVAPELADGSNEVNNQTSTPEAQPADLVSGATASDSPEMTPEERAAKVEYIDALSHDILYPNDPEYNQEQLENIKVMDSLLKNYPHAFTKGSTDDGRNYLLLKKATKTGRVDSKYNINKADLELRDHGDGGIIFSYRGVMEFVDTDKTYTKDTLYDEDFDLAPLLDIEDIGNTPRFEERGWISKNASFRFPSKDGTKIAEICKPIFSRYEDARLDVLKGYIMDAEEAHKNDVEKKALTAEDILKELL